MPELTNLLSNIFNRRLTELEGELAAARERIKELEAKLETDPLLNILNRRGFERELKRALAYANRYRTNVAVLVIAFDNLQAVNDRYSHLAGDAILMAASAAVVRDLRASDVVSRFGSDEFALLLWNLDEADAREKARYFESLIGTLEVRFSAEIMPVAASAGLTMLKRFDSPENVIARAAADVRSSKRRRTGETEAVSMPPVPVKGYAAA